MKGDAIDPKALIREAYAIDGITLSECRTIFLDWALSVPIDSDTKDLIVQLLERYQSGAPDHPMTVTLAEGLETMNTPRRRGGWRSRNR
jgi:hypothetical protein